MHHHLAHMDGSNLDRRACRRLKDNILHFSGLMAVDTATLRKTWHGLHSLRGSRSTREDQFELLVDSLLAGIPGLDIVEKRALRPSGEVDLVIRNDSADPFCRRLAEQIVVACEVGRRQPVVGTCVTDLLTRMAVNGWKAGFLVGLRGVAPTAVGVADNVSGNHLFIALVGPDEVAELIDAHDRAESIKLLVRRARRRRIS